MKDLEYLFYESQPYLYMMVAAIGLLYGGTSMIPILASLVLVACSIGVLMMRRQYRNTPSRISHIR